MKKFILCVFVFLVATSYAEAGEFFKGWRKASAKTETLVIETPAGEKHEFNVEIARTPEELETGLMNRKSMPADHGMLFVFDDYQQRRFWMRNTLIPLDLLFMTESGVIHHIHNEAKPLDLTGIPSYGPAKAVLEINGGMAEKLDIPEGSRVIHPFFKAEQP